MPRRGYGRGTAPRPRSVPEDPPVLEEPPVLEDPPVLRITKWRDNRNRWVIDLPPLPFDVIVECKIECLGGSKLLQVPGQDTSRRIYVNAKGEADEWESPIGCGHRLLIYSPGEPTKEELLADAARVAGG